MDNKYLKDLSRALLLIIGCSIFQISQAQRTVSGLVKSRQGSIPGASVLIKGTLSGTTTDSTGHYSFTTDSQGDQVLVISSVGYKAIEKQVTLNIPSLTIDIILQQDNSTMEPVVISAGSFIASDKAKGASLTPVDVVTTAGNGGDIANALRTLPGVQQIGDQAGLFVRGGTGDEASQFIDGTLFRNPNYTAVPGILQPARVSPFLFNGIVFSSGGYSALYGDAMSAALILETIDLPEKSSAILGASPIVGVAGFQELDKNHRYSYGINSRYVNYNPYSKVIKQQPDYFHGPEFWSTDANFRIKLGKGGMLKYYVIAGYNNTGLSEPDIDSSILHASFQLEGTNVYHNLSYKGQLGQDWKIDLGTTYTYNRDHITTGLYNNAGQKLYLPAYPYDDKNTMSITTSHYAEARIVLTRYLPGGHILRFGGDAMYASDHYNFRNQEPYFQSPGNQHPNDDSRTIITENITAAFAETDLRITSNLAAKTGLRYEYATLLHQGVLAPRISIGYRLPGMGQFNAAYGVFYQPPANQYIHQSPGMDYAFAEHWMLNYLKSFKNRTIRVEAYYKQYNRLPRLSTDSLYTNTGNGYAKGIELFWRDKTTIRNLDYWITYTYLDTRRTWLNFPAALHPNFATPHTASIVVKRYFEKFNTSVNAAYTFATGRPYYDILTDHNGSSTLSDRGTTVDYQSLNLTISYLCHLFKNRRTKDFTIINFGMNNVLGNNPVFGYNYSSNGQHKQPVTLPAPRTLFIGIFVNFGIDRRNDDSENNL